MSVGGDEKLDSCGCCVDLPEVKAPHNPPGQPRLAYRIGTHGTFLERMLARIPRYEPPEEEGGAPAGLRPLKRLTTRSVDDPSIAVMDAWAAVADVLAFYQERIANEGFLGTATERRSVLWLARAIGYELAPGVAAGTYLAFTVDESDKTPDRAIIPAGTPLMSIPAADGERPQTYETSDDFEARVRWNVLRPRQTRYESPTLTGTPLYLKGIATGLNRGDVLVLVARDPAGGVALKAVRRRVTAITADLENKVTEVHLGGGTAVAAGSFGGAYTPPFTEPVDGAAFGREAAHALLHQTYTEADLAARLERLGWDEDDLLRFADEVAERGGLDALADESDPDVSGPAIAVYALRQQVGVFGNGAPLYGTLPTATQVPDKSVIISDIQAKYRDYDDGTGLTVWADSHDGEVNYAAADMYLEREVKEIVPGGFVVLEDGSNNTVFKVSAVIHGSLNGFAISGKATGLTLTRPDGTANAKPAAYKFRTTTAYCVAEALELAPVPETDDLAAEATQLELDRMVPGLSVRGRVALTGIRADVDGDVAHTEIKEIAAITHAGGYTTLTFTEGMEYGYLRDTVTLSANLVAATHGETVNGEILGGGDGTRANQRFTLKKQPLTHVSAPTASGREAELSVRVDGVKWRRVETLFGRGAEERVYMVRIDDDARATLTFGDGGQGARLPSGEINVTADYRSGIGPVGEAEPGRITLLKRKPFGVKSVTNPVRAGGAEAREDLGDARDNAPVRTITLDRIVSLTDYEDFARTYAGIGKARAVAVHLTETDWVHLTAAEAGGLPLDRESELGRKLVDAIDAARDPARPVRVDGYVPKRFNLSARVRIHPDHLWAKVEPVVRAALLSAFGFEARGFAQAVTAAEVIEVIVNAHDGVVMVDLEELYIEPKTLPAQQSQLDTVLPASAARAATETELALDPDMRVRPAELLLINEPGVTLSELPS